MSHSGFLKYTNSPEFRDMLQRYEAALNAGEFVFFDSDDLIDIADYYHSNNELDKAEGAVDYCLHLYPDNSGALLYKARMSLMDYHDVESAKTFAEKASEDDGRMNLFYVKAEIMMATGQWKRAEEYLQQMEENRKNDISYDTDDDDISDEDSDEDLYLDVASLYLDYNNSHGAERWVSRCTNLKDDNLADYYDIWAHIHMLNAEWDEAINSFNKVLDIDAYDTNAWLALCEAYYNTRNYNDALQCSDYAISIDPNLAEAHFTKGNCLLAMQKPQDAIACYERYLRSCPGDTLTELFMATALYSLDRKTEAFNYINRVLDKVEALDQPYKNDALRMGALIHSDIGESDKADWCCDQMTDKSDDAEANVMRAMVCLMRNQDTEAQQHALAAMRQSDYDEDIMLQLVTMYFTTERWVTSINTVSFIEALAQKNGKEYPWGQLFAFKVAAMRHINYNKEYIEYLQRATEIAPQELEILMNDYFPPGTHASDYVALERQRLGLDKV